jgi:hypothetical protein
VVASLISRSAAISALDSPRPRQARTSRSRGELLEPRRRSRRPGRGREPRDDTACDLGCEHAVPAGDRPDRGHQGRCVNGLEEEPGRARLERGADVLVEVERGEHEYFGYLVGDHPAGRLDPVDAGHADVHQDHVRLVRPGRRDGGEPVGGLAGADWFLVDRYLLPPFVALGLLGLVTTLVLRSRHEPGPLRRGIAAVGRTALSCYVLQTVLAGALCYGWGLDLAARLDGARPWWVVGMWAGISAMLLVTASTWLRRFDRGPLELIAHRLYSSPERQQGGLPPTRRQ